MPEVVALTDGFKLARMIQHNGCFIDWRDDDRAPKHWGYINQTSYHEDVTTVHSAGFSVKISSNSVSTGNTRMLYQQTELAPLGDPLIANDNKHNYDFSTDRKTHTLKFGFWSYGTALNCPSGTIYGLLSVDGFTYSPYNTLASEWEYIETDPITFTGSTGGYFCIVKADNTDALQVRIAESRALIDDMEVYVDYGLKDISIAQTTGKRIGMRANRKVLYEYKAFNLPVRALTRDKANTIIDWHLKGHDLLLRPSVSSASIHPTSCFLTGSKFKVRKLDGVNTDLLSGNIVLEEMS
jgi:hypothetical protein